MWDVFFHSVEDPAGIGLFRIVFGLLLLIDAGLYAREAKYLLYPDGLYPIEPYRSKTLSSGFSLFHLLPQTRSSVHLVLLIYAVGALGVLFGLATRISAIVVFIALASIQNRNRWCLHSGDTLLLVLSFLLIFSNAGKAYSLDNRLFGPAENGTMWAHRLMQIQVSVVYLHATVWKLKGATWRRGEAVYYALNLLTHRRRKLPEWLYRKTFFQLATYSTLLVEGALGTLVWVPRLRYWVLGAGVLLHVGINAFMRMHIFQWTMIVSFLVFVDSEVAARIVDVVTSFV